MAAINLQRDAGVMLSNLQILSQFAMAMNRMSFSMMALGLGRSLFPRAEVDALAPAPRAVRPASYMSAMGLWHPQNSPNVPGPVPASSCHSCMNCKYCFPTFLGSLFGTRRVNFHSHIRDSTYYREQPHAASQQWLPMHHSVKKPNVLPYTLY